MEWLVLPQVSKGGKTGLDLLSLWFFVLFALVLFETLLLGLEFVWALPLFCWHYSYYFVFGLSLVWVDGTDILIVPWFFTMVARWFGLDGVLLWGLLRHSVYGHFVWSFQTIQFQLPLKMRHNLLICAILQMRLVNWPSSGEEALWHRWIAQGSLERQLRMRLSPISGVHLENQLTSRLRD